MTITLTENEAMFKHTFNGVFDRKLTVWDALSQVARCGRAVAFLQGGLVRFVRDEPKTLPVALFSPRNIVKGSFKIDYVMLGEDTADIRFTKGGLI